MWGVVPPALAFRADVLVLDVLRGLRVHPGLWEAPAGQELTSPMPTLQYHVITTPELGRSPGGQWAGCQEKLVSRLLPEAGVSRCPYLGGELYLGFQQRRGEVSSQHGRCRVLRCCVCPHGRGQGGVGFNGQQASRLLSDHDGNYPGDILLSPNSSCNLLGGSQRQPA